MHRMFDRTASLLFIAVGAAFILGARNLSSTAYGSRVGPDIFPMGLGAVGIWIGLSIGIAVYALLLVWRFHVLTKRGYLPALSSTE